MVSEPSENSAEEGLAVAGCKGQLAAAKAPCKGAVGHGQPPLQGRSVAAKAPCKGATGHLQGAAARRGNSPQGAATRGCARKGRPPAASPQEAAHSAPTRGSRQQGRWRRPQGWSPLVGRLPIATRSVVAYAGAMTAQEGEGEG
ncbi:hypothetical protein GW17_00042914 [Ensete ventricosum]|nr:hypothetical protein GW17_00042914 [Ensete ventricosum]